LIDLVQNQASEARPGPNWRGHWRSLLLAFGLSFGVAGLGGALTDLSDWYYQLKQPAWKPPDPAFGAIWTVIFSLSAVSGWIGWHRLPTLGLRRLALVLWGLNAFFNVLWSWLYFTLRRPDWAMLEVPLLLLSILALIAVHRQRSPWSAGLLVPYLVWVSIATCLNWSTIVLNGPFA
jgi:tryptophan-rich sensory protein